MFAFGIEQVGVWYLSVIFLTLYFGVLILRMLIFTMFWIVGFDFWIFPNLNDEPPPEFLLRGAMLGRCEPQALVRFFSRYCGFLDSFQPLYSWEKRKDDALMLLVRFGSLGIAAVAIQQIAETTSFEDVQDGFCLTEFEGKIDSATGQAQLQRTGPGHQLLRRCPRLGRGQAHGIADS